MKKIILFMLLACVCVIATKQETHVALAEIRQTPFGATILNAVQVNIAAGQEVDPIIYLVTQILEQLHDTQTEVESRYSLNQARCNQNMQSFQKQIEDTENAMSNLDISIKLNEDNLEKDTDSLDQANSDYENTSVSIEKGNTDREDSEKRWKEADIEIEDALNAIDEATRLVQHMSHGVSFAQVKNKYDLVLEKFITNKSRHSTLFKPLILALSSISSELSNSEVQKILSLLQNIREALSETKSEGIAAEQTAAKLWASLLDQLVKNKERYGDERSRLQDSINYLNNIIKQQKISLQNNESSYENFVLQLSEEESLCEKQEQDYISDSIENKREMDILEELNEHLKEKFSSVVEFIQ